MTKDIYTHCENFIEVNIDSTKQAAQNLHDIAPMTWKELHWHIAVLIDRAALAGLCPECFRGIWTTFPRIYAQNAIDNGEEKGSLQ